MSINWVECLKRFKELLKGVYCAIKILEKFMKLRLLPLFILFFSFCSFQRFPNVDERIINAYEREAVIGVKSEEFVYSVMVKAHLGLFFAISVDEDYLLGDCLGQNLG